MNRALLVKTLRDAWLLLAGALAALLTFEMLLVLAMSSLAPDLLKLWSSVPFLKNIVLALTGLDVAGEVSVNTLVAIGMVHPFLFAVSWGLLITLCTRVTVGEIDRGTADLLLSLPIARATVVITTSVVWAVAAGLMCGCAFLGTWTGSRIWLEEPLEMRQLAMASANLLALYGAIGATTVLVSSIVDRRGVAVGVVLTILLFSFLINFLEPFLDWVDAISFLGILDYYRPLETVRDGTWPLRNIAVLAGIALLTWSAGLVIFCRKDIPVR